MARENRHEFARCSEASSDDLVLASDSSPENPRVEYCIRGLRIGPTQLALIRQVLRQNETKGRTRASLELCDLLNYHQPNGWPKERAMRDVLRRLAARGVVELPISKIPEARSRVIRPLKRIDVDQSPIRSALRREIVVQRVLDNHSARLWDQLISDHHYLGRRPIVGRNLRQLVFMGGRPIACLAWSDPCLKLAPRDEYLLNRLRGEARSIDRGVNNTRFLVLPWVDVPNLASKVLARATRHMRDHWGWYYHADIEWAETFIDQSRFRGTCYLAANWRQVGSTKGTSRSGSSTKRLMHGLNKDILVYLFGRRRSSSRDG